MTGFAPDVYVVQEEEGDTPAETRSAYLEQVPPRIARPRFRKPRRKKRRPEEGGGRLVTHGSYLDVRACKEPQGVGRGHQEETPA